MPATETGIETEIETGTETETEMIIRREAVVVEEVRVNGASETGMVLVIATDELDTTATVTVPIIANAVDMSHTAVSIETGIETGTEIITDTVSDVTATVKREDRIATPTMTMTRVGGRMHTQTTMELALALGAWVPPP
mgnify:CR=1 FL=1